jgi:hypothetical protein
MAEDIKTPEDDIPPESLEKAKKQGKLGALILVVVLLLSIVLPPEYKAFAPILFIVPFVMNVVNKIRQAREKSENPLQEYPHSPPVPDGTPSIEPYSYKPKDPKDPRKYKPIG